MKTYNIRFKKQPEKFIKSRSKGEQKRLLCEIYKLPDCKNVKKMAGYDNRFRLRIGDTRVIYDKHDDTFIILIVQIGSRGDVYKNME